MGRSQHAPHWNARIRIRTVGVVVTWASLRGSLPAPWGRRCAVLPSGQEGNLCHCIDGRCRRPRHDSTVPSGGLLDERRIRIDVMRSTMINGNRSPTLVGHRSALYRISSHVRTNGIERLRGGRSGARVRTIDPHLSATLSAIICVPLTFAPTPIHTARSRRRGPAELERSGQAFSSCPSRAMQHPPGRSTERRYTMTQRDDSRMPNARGTRDRTALHSW